MKKFGLIGFPLTHSFSRKYFTEKFEREGLSGTHVYDLYEMENYRDVLRLVSEEPELLGLNVTIPHKQHVITLLDAIDPSAKRIGAVNVIRVLEGKKLKGYNSDYYGFRKSLLEFMPHAGPGVKALVLGYGGAAKAVVIALEDLGIACTIVSRQPGDHTVSYEAAAALTGSHHLIINCSPLGTYPDTDRCPDIPYALLGPEHYLYDLVYNPEETLFMKKGREHGASATNGYAMLVYQAEKAWEIWHTDE